MNKIYSTSVETLYAATCMFAVVMLALFSGAPTASAQTPQLPTPEMNPVTCSADGTTASLEWRNVAEAQTYALRVDDVANNTNSCLDGWFCDTGADYLNDSYSSNSYLVNDLIPGKPYSWWVHAKNIGTWDGISGWTKRTFSCANTIEEPTETPSDGGSQSSQQLPTPSMNPVRCSADGTEATLTWGRVSAGDTYALRVDDPAGNGRQCNDNWNCGTGVDFEDNSYNRTSYKVENVIPGKTYSWWVHRKYSGTWDGISGWSKRTFSCAVESPQTPVDNSDGATSEQINPSGVSVDMADYFNSKNVPAGLGVELLVEGYPHRVNVDQGKDIAFVGKNFSTNENYDILTVNNNTIEFHYEVSESSDYVRRFTPSSKNQFSYQTLPSERSGALWAPRYPELGQPYNASHNVDYFTVTKRGESRYNSSQSPVNVSMVVWVDYVPADVRIDSIGYTSDHLVRVSQKWSDCNIEEYIYAENVGIVDWRPLNRLGCYDLNPGQTYTMFGDVTGGITYQGMEGGEHSFVDGKGDSLDVVYAPNFYNNGAIEAYVHVRPKDESTYFLSVGSIDDDWKLVPDFAGIHVDDFPAIRAFDSVDQTRTSALEPVVEVGSFQAPVPTSAPLPPLQTSAPATPTTNSITLTALTTDTLNVRTLPSTTSEVSAVVPQGMRGTVLSGPAVANGYQWYNIQYDNGVQGWSAANWVALNSNTAVAPTNETIADRSDYSDEELKIVIRDLMDQIRQLMDLQMKR